jgi:hypothetical protein
VVINELARLRHTDARQHQVAQPAGYIARFLTGMWQGLDAKHLLERGGLQLPGAASLSSAFGWPMQIWAAVTRHLLTCCCIAVAVQIAEVAASPPVQHLI